MKSKGGTLQSYYGAGQRNCDYLKEKYQEPSVRSSFF